MTEITCNPEDGALYIKISGDNFQDLVETLKNFGCRWNPTIKRWQSTIVKFEDLKREILYCNGHEEYIQISELTKSQINTYMLSLKELRINRTRSTYHPELMHFNNLAGKHPFENYQMDDLLQAINKNRYLFAWEMGLGKSWALAALLEHLRFYNKIDKALIFSSPIGVYNVKSELIKFGKNQKDEDIKVFTSISEIKKYEDRDVFNVEKYPFKTIIMTYDCIKAVSNFYYDQKKGTSKNPKPSQKTQYRESPIPLKEWSGGKNMGIFLDECHLLGNPDSRRSEIMNMNMKFFEFRYLFTGTLADVYQKLYVPCKILDKVLVKGMGYTDWLGTYCELGNRFSKYAINRDGWDMDKINELNSQLISTYGAKRLKKDCLDLPDRYMVPTIWIDMSEKQLEIYKAFSNESAQIFQKEAQEKDMGFSDKMKNMFAFFQMAVDNPEIIKNSEKYPLFTDELKRKIEKFSYVKDNNKLKCLDAILEERVDEEGESGIIWCYHPHTVKCLAERYKDRNPVVISSDMSREERFAEIDKFKKNFGKKNSSKIIIAAITLMNTSVTLTECSFDVYVEATYNFTDYEQSTGRIWRPGIDHVSRSYAIRFKDCIDSLQEQNLKMKGQTLNSLLSKKYITQSEWKKIFNGQNVI